MRRVGAWLAGGLVLVGAPWIVAAVITGGFGYVRGAIAASFLIGLAESLAAGYVSYAYKDAIAFVVMVLVLLVRPQGLFGRRIGI